MTNPILNQCELVKGNTHWISWFDDEELRVTAGAGWRVLHRYRGTPMVRNKEGRLIPPEE